MPSKKNLTKLTRGLSILEQYIHPAENLTVHTAAEGLYLNTEKYDLVPSQDHQELLERLGWVRLARGYMWENPGGNVMEIGPEPPFVNEGDSSAITVGIHKRYIQNQALTDEAKALLLEGQLKEGVDWVEYSENMGDEFLPVTLR